MQWAEEHIRKDVCRLNSKVASTTSILVESIIVRLRTGGKFCLGKHIDKIEHEGMGTSRADKSL